MVYGLNPSACTRSTQWRLIASRATVYYLYMRSVFLLPLIVGLAVVVGGLLYLFGSAPFQQSSLPSDTNGATNQQGTQGKGSEAFTVLAKGQNAGGIDQRVNYRITDPDQFALLWEMIYTANGPSVPVVDFGKQEVLALFDGSHSTGGYAIGVTGIDDKDGRRVIMIERTEPGESCSTSNAVTSPFILVTVPTTELTFDHVDTVQTTECR